jgi:hypothetical protein
MHQTAIQVDVSAQEVSREKSLGGAIALCAKVAGLEAKQLQDQLHLDKAQFSRWESGGEGVMWPKLVALMDACGNDAPLLWMLHARGYDLHSVRKLESETEAQNRLLREEVAALRRVLLAGGK